MSDQNFEETETLVLDEKTKDLELSELITFIEGRFNRSKDWRRFDEERWLQSYRNYRGLYGPDVQFTEAERSRVFIKVTKTKVLAAYGQITDVLFARQKFPLSIEPTVLPEGVSEAVHFDPKTPPEQTEQQEEQSPYGFPGDGQDLEAGETLESLQEKKIQLGPLEEKLSDIEGLVEGEGLTPSAATFHPAMVAAKKMEKQIMDQLEESGASKHLRSSTFECALFGTGILKGPFAVDKEYANWDEEGVYSPTIKTVPQVKHVSCWDLYPDPDASNMDDASYVIERHKLSRSQLRQLKERPYFRKEAIDRCVEMGEVYSSEYWEDDLKDYYLNDHPERYQILEYWGLMETDIAKDYGIDLPKEYNDVDQIQVNCWICNNFILRLVVNPFKPARIPYYAVPYELNPYSFFGIGLAENMDDTQTLMNGFMRMAVDNAVLSGNLLIEVDETNLVPGQDLQVYPGKVFRRQGGAPGQAIFGTKFPNVSNENMQLFDKARQLSDEATGLPSFAHGQTGVTGTGRTAAGISMLMGAAAGSVKTVVKNFDDYLLRPLGEAFFSFNMQFNFDSSIKGDLEIKARGTESLMANEVRSQRLLQFLQVVANPALAPFAKFTSIIREIANSMGLDPDKVCNTPEEALRQAKLLQQQQPEQPPQAQAPGAQGLNPNDQTGGGGGNIGVGAAPVPMEGQFSGTEQQPQPTQQAQAAGQQQAPMGPLQ
jgi:hypothetical protein|tara:strand:+ start:184 stop:2319 length:2136 start_codon:yes stop_codon:yes gene_type:complete